MKMFEFDYLNVPENCTGLFHKIMREAYGAYFNLSDIYMGFPGSARDRVRRSNLRERVLAAFDDSAEKYGWDFEYMDDGQRCLIWETKKTPPPKEGGVEDEVTG